LVARLIGFRGIGWAGGRRVYGTCIVVVHCRPGVGGQGPDEGGDPTDKGPTQEKIKGEDAAGIVFFAGEGDDSRQEIWDNATKEEDRAECSGEKGKE